MKKKSATPKGEFQDQGSQDMASQNRELFGKVPEKFSPRRMLAGQALGFRFFRLNEDERLQLNDDNFIYDGMFWDATLCAFLCVCKPDLLFKAVRTPDAVIAQIMKWADEHEVHPGGPGFAEVMDHYTVVMEAMIRSSAEQVSSTEKKPGNAEGELLPGE